MLKIFGCFFFQAEDGIRDVAVTGVQTCALPISTGGTLVVVERRAVQLLAPEPRSEQEPRLDPCELPRNGPERAQAATAPARGTAADVQAVELRLGGRGVKVPHEPGVLVNDTSEAPLRRRGQMVHDPPPARFHGSGHRQHRVEGGGSVYLER